MKLLLINSPVRLDAKPNCIPYGLATIASVVRNLGHDVEIYDINAFRHGRKEIVSYLSGKTWDAVGVSGLITTFAFQEWLIPELKKINPKAPVISGGGLATSNSNLLFKNTPLDIAVSGEGEETLPLLLDATRAGGDLKTIRGVSYRTKEGNVVRNPPSQNIRHLDPLPHPAWDLLPTDIYLKNPIWGGSANNSSGFRTDIPVRRSMNVISSRGCPFSCNYCYHLFGRGSYRFRSAESMVNEIETLIERYDVDFIGFVDDNMMAGEERIYEFCRMMIAKRLPVAWGCHGRVSSATPGVLEKMARAGCVWIGYGIESGSQKILDAMKKKTTVSQALMAITETRKAGIFPNTTFIFGYPGETRDTIQETIDFKLQASLECGSFFATPYPGTPLYASVSHLIADEEAFIRSLGDATQFTINLTPFATEELFELKRNMDANIPVI